ncbi:hypothetical protein U6A24_09905 [Aquimarina gracilis]|uniref:Outer membrane protein beta-barrel domain-containing protein n=1 Tax=Aquimarina gracilis TaxID=874422 RepID=A0ABU5ZUL4_9FLAO|nr:hypothetical protein [Aquimarina gracilis]MEB3345776.1 hypothetical protein [Aquimarina gracilis]
MVPKLLCYIFFLFFSVFAFCQNLGQIGKAKLFKLTGGVAANTVFYEGEANRDPFTYFITGNVNLNISGVYNIPFSFSYTNQKFQNSNPFSFNRLSIHPSYKWATAHVGDVSMTFSPYTLSGHQFTGLGVDLTPGSKFKISAMYGRLLKESEYVEDDPQSEPAYKRIGYGLKTLYTEDKFSIGLTFFKASDDENSLETPVPLELELQPKENIVASLEGGLKFFDRGELRIEAASSAITEDINAAGEEADPFILSSFLNNNVTTQHYKAYNANLSYQVAKGSIGVGYEYIDPEYRTFGAYFFNNDLENITLNATQSVFADKVNISFNGGLQKDDLDNTKSSQLQRVVSAVNVTYTASEKFNLSGGYSNFQSFTNIKDQFDFINEVSQTDNLDTLDFQQISQNANLNANYILKDSEDKKRNLNVALSFQNAVNKQGGEVAENGDSKFYNGTAAYTMGYPERSLNIATAVNVSYSTIGVDNSLTFGPTVSVNKQFFEKKLRTTGSVSYNQSSSNGEKQSDVTNIRLSGNYTFKKKHNFSLNLLSQLRSTTTASNQNFTATFAYNYTFDKFKAPKFKWPKKKEKDKNKDKDKDKKKKKRSKKDELLNFRYRDSVYNGTMSEINYKLTALQDDPHFDHIPEYKKGELTMLRQIVADQKNISDYKVKAIDFLKELYSYEDYLEGYHNMVFDIIVELRRDMMRLDYAFEKAFVKAKVAVDNHQLHKRTPEERLQAHKELQETYARLEKNSEIALARLIGHRWMLPIISKYKTIEKIEKPDEYLSKLMEQEKENIFRLKDKGETDQEIELYLISQIIDFYMKESVKHTDPDKFVLKYIEKN